MKVVRGIFGCFDLDRKDTVSFAELKAAIAPDSGWGDEPQQTERPSSEAWTNGDAGGGIGDGADNESDGEGQRRRELWRRQCQSERCFVARVCAVRGVKGHSYDLQYLGGGSFKGVAEVPRFHRFRLVPGQFPPLSALYSLLPHLCCPLDGPETASPSRCD